MATIRNCLELLKEISQIEERINNERLKIPVAVNQLINDEEILLKLIQDRFNQSNP